MNIEECYECEHIFNIENMTNAEYIALDKEYNQKKRTIYFCKSCTPNYDLIVDYEGKLSYHKVIPKKVVVVDKKL